MNPQDPPQKTAGKPVSWQAPEYIEHHHPASWYASLVLASAVLAAVIYFLTKDIFAVVITALLGAIVGIAASHKPKTITYSLSGSSLSLNSKAYQLKLYKSFSVVDEGEIVSATLMPLKRFMLPLAIYFNHTDTDKIVDALSARLPHDDRPADAVERLASRLRF